MSAAPTFGVCVGGALEPDGEHAVAGDAVDHALRVFAEQRAEHGDSAEPVQILIWAAD